LKSALRSPRIEEKYLLVPKDLARSVVSLDEDTNEIIADMKRTCATCCSLVYLIALALTPAQAQPTPGMPPQPPRPPGVGGGGGGGNGERAPLSRFNLDFPGGTPKELVVAIQKALGKPLNAIIPDELAATKLPALKMNDVDVAQLFQALAAASRKSEAVVSGNYSPLGGTSYQIAETSCGFRQGSEGRTTDETIWYFYAQKPAFPPFASSAKVCRFYSLAPYLDRGTSVDDITTAIETGWKMLGEPSPPTISFHKDTKLLIAVGEPTKLETISAVLTALEPPKTPPGGYPAAAAKPPEKPLTGK
jgi:hypothetical protein